jgi:hypothetical protein
MTVNAAGGNDGSSRAAGGPKSFITNSHVFHPHQRRVAVRHSGRGRDDANGALDIRADRTLNGPTPTITALWSMSAFAKLAGSAGLAEFRMAQSPAIHLPKILSPFTILRPKSGTPGIGTVNNGSLIAALLPPRYQSNCHQSPAFTGKNLTSISRAALWRPLRPTA